MDNKNNRNSIKDIVGSTQNKQISAEIIDDIRDQSIQPRLKRDMTASGILGIVSGVTTGALIPPWWSKARDTALRNFWKKGDHTSSAIYTLQTNILLSVSLSTRIRL